MKTITFTPHANLGKMSSEFKARWAEALMTSVQHKGLMSNDTDTAHCCLCVAAKLEGATYKDYARLSGPLDRFAPISRSVSVFGFYAAEARGCEFDFMALNDKHLTHPQIAALLRGESVTIEVES